MVERQCNAEISLEMIEAGKAAFYKFVLDMGGLDFGNDGQSRRWINICNLRRNVGFDATIAQKINNFVRGVAKLVGDFS